MGACERLGHVPEEAEAIATTEVSDDDRATALLSSVADGSQEAFSELYDLLAPRVFGLIQRILVDRAQAEEVAQEVFLEVWQTATRFAPNKGGARGWILTMAHRRAVDRVRASQAGRDRDVRIGIRDRKVEYDSVSEDVELKLESERVDRALRTLSDIQRQAISLAYHGGLSQSEVAERLGIPLGTVKTRIRDGMIKLREELGVAL
ncbi:ECF RNA polymerase sigma factor SigK [Mycetocola zhadangensis]|uniref:Sigma-70 family RNA polymerase sigma factor n=1 Tax=Mycetocola zhadangensis TaxID=1164595 RepID=A0A3L7J4J3_9MICO|nr:sigma-70 family RNA polymerase sigma factor [Mycetocola zhadangensis]GGE83304.1 RNA polymerase sigma factor SigK [Mycetocola zhadangensis]